MNTDRNDTSRPVGRMAIVIGFFLTAAVVLTLSSILYFHYSDSSLEKKMSPNELGDTLAGFFGGLAFFWLVLGYFLQKKQIEINTVSLQIQTEELKSSVKELSAQTDTLRKTLSQVEEDSAIRFWEFSKSVVARQGKMFIQRGMEPTHIERMKLKNSSNEDYLFELMIIKKLGPATNFIQKVVNDEMALYFREQYLVGVEQIASRFNCLQKREDFLRAFRYSVYVETYMAICLMFELNDRIEKFSAFFAEQNAD